MMKRKTGEETRKRRTTAIAKLRPAEAKKVLRALLKARPEIHEQAEEIARSLISDASFEEVAGEV